MESIKKVKIGLIYMYTSPSGKKYIGQTINEKSRKGGHRNLTNKENTYFGKALRKYGFDNFTYEVIIKFKPTLDIKRLKRVLNKLEMRYIKLYKTKDPMYGYNLTEGGDGTLGHEQSDETKELIRQSSVERMKDPAMRYKAGSALRGKTNPRQEEIKIKLSNSCKTKKKICQYNTKLELLNTFNSIADAARAIDNTATLKTKSNRISECINGKWQSAYDFIWMREG